MIDFSKNRSKLPIKEEKIKLDEYNNSQIGIYTKYEIEQVKEIDRKTDKFDYIVDYKL